MEWVQVEGREIPLLEPPETHKETPRHVLQVLFKYKRLISITFLVISIPALLILLLLPTKYRATAKVFIKPSRAYVNLSGADTGIGMAVSPDVLNSEIQIIKSRELFGQVLKELPFPDDGFFSYAGIDASPVKASSLIEIHVDSSNPTWSVEAVNKAADLYQDHHVRVHKTQGVQEFYDKQEKKLRSELIAAEEALKAFQAKEKIIDAPQEVTADLNALALAEKSLKETDSTTRELEQRIAVLDDQLKQQKATISSSTNITVNPVYTQISNRLTQLELERDSLLQRYTPDHRLVKDKDAEIQELKKTLESTKPTSVGSENISLNDVHRRILNELLTARVQLRAANERKAVLTRQVENYSLTAADKRRKGFDYDRLLRDIKVKKENLDLYSKKAEEARISDAMDERKFSNAYVLEKAAPPAQRAGRSPLLLTFLTIVGALAVAVGTAFAFEYLDRSVRNERDIEEQIGLPVLATIQNYGEFQAAPSK